jgi:hypothetical protein
VLSQTLFLVLSHILGECRLHPVIIGYNILGNVFLKISVVANFSAKKLKKYSPPPSPVPPEPPENCSDHVYSVCVCGWFWCAVCECVVRVCRTWCLCVCVCVCVWLCACVCWYVLVINIIPIIL